MQWILILAAAVLLLANKPIAAPGARAPAPAATAPPATLPVIDPILARRRGPDPTIGFRAWERLQNLAPNARAFVADGGGGRSPAPGEKADAFARPNPKRI